MIIEFLLVLVLSALLLVQCSANRKEEPVKGGKGSNREETTKETTREGEGSGGGGGSTSGTEKEKKEGDKEEKKKDDGETTQKSDNEPDEKRENPVRFGGVFDIGAMGTPRDMSNYSNRKDIETDWDSSRDQRESKKGSGGMENKDQKEKEGGDKEEKKDDGETTQKSEQDEKREKSAQFGGVFDIGAMGTPRDMSNYSNRKEIETDWDSNRDQREPKKGTGEIDTKEIGAVKQSESAGKHDKQGRRYTVSTIGPQGAPRDMGEYPFWEDIEDGEEDEEEKNRREESTPGVPIE